MEQVVEHAGVDIWALISERFAQIKRGLRRLFGCWHLKLSLPFTRGAETYRTCLTCGARRRFDLDQWTMVGDFTTRGSKIQLWTAVQYRAVRDRVESSSVS